MKKSWVKRGVIIFMFVAVLFALGFISTNISHNSSNGSIVGSMVSASVASCFDDDNDEVCNFDDLCPATPLGMIVDNDGCSHEQFCKRQPICGPGCDLADWKDNSNNERPNDCTTVIINVEGGFIPKCVALECKKELNIPDINISFVIYKSTESYITVKLSNVPAGYDITNATYPGWCVDPSHTIQIGDLINGTLYLSTDPELYEKCPSCASTNWTYVNYILNHKNGNMTDIQSAIHYFVGGGNYPTTQAAKLMVENALLYGSNFTPKSGEFIAVIIYVDEITQLIIIEVDP